LKIRFSQESVGSSPTFGTQAGQGLTTRHWPLELATRRVTLQKILHERALIRSLRGRLAAEFRDEQGVRGRLELPRQVDAAPRRLVVLLLHDGLQRLVRQPVRVERRERPAQVMKTIAAAPSDTGASWKAS